MGRFSRDDSGNEPHDMGEVKVTAATEKALLCVPAQGGQFWIPKSVVHDDSEVWKKDDEGKLVVKYWWAEKNGHA
jgi:hypothetical protein